MTRQKSSWKRCEGGSPNKDLHAWALESLDLSLLLCEHPRLTSFVQVRNRQGVTFRYHETFEADLLSGADTFFLDVRVNSK